MVETTFANLKLTSHPDNIVQSGSTVHGHLEFAYQQHATIRGIRVEIIGVTKTHWIETEFICTGSSNGADAIPYGYKQYHYKRTILLWGSPPTAPNADVRAVPTTHTVLAFVFDLPTNLPESYEGEEYGFTRYYVKAIFDSPGKFGKEICTIFTVTKEVNLNSMGQLLKNPEDLTRENRFDKAVRLTCCCTPFLCCGRFHYELNVSKLGYVPGEYIVVSGNVRNETGRELRKLAIRLIQVVTFYGQRYPTTVEVGEELNPQSCHTRQLVTTITKLLVHLGDEIPSGKTVAVGVLDTDSSLQLLVPAVPASRVQDGSPITITYSLEVTTKSEGCFHLRKEITPILIGTIPLLQLPMWFPSSQPLLTDPVVCLEPPHPNYQESFSKRERGHVNVSQNSDVNEPSSIINVEEVSVSFIPKYVFYNPDSTKHN